MMTNESDNHKDMFNDILCQESHADLYDYVEQVCGSESDIESKVSLCGFCDSRVVVTFRVRACSR